MIVQSNLGFYSSDCDRVVSRSYPRDYTLIGGCIFQTTVYCFAGYHLHI